MIDNRPLAGLLQEEIAIHNFQGGEMVSELFKTPAGRDVYKRAVGVVTVERPADLPHSHIAAELVISGPEPGIKTIITEELGKEFSVANKAPGLEARSDIQSRFP